MLNLLKWFGLVALALVNLVQLFLYRRVRRDWNDLEVVPATITRNKLDDHLTVDGGRNYEANIAYRYRHDGKEYESEEAILRGPQLFPLWNYESAVVDRYKVGETYEARVHPGDPRISYLELAPLNIVSAIFLPILTVLYAAALIGWIWFVGQRM